MQKIDYGNIEETEKSFIQSENKCLFVRSIALEKRMRNLSN